jgi:hypothetical protein
MFYSKLTIATVIAVGIRFWTYFPCIDRTKRKDRRSSITSQFNVSYTVGTPIRDPWPVWLHFGITACLIHVEPFTFAVTHSTVYSASSRSDVISTPSLHKKAWHPSTTVQVYLHCANFTKRWKRSGEERNEAPNSCSSMGPLDFRATQLLVDRFFIIRIHFLNIHWLQKILDCHGGETVENLILIATRWLGRTRKGVRTG